jgi:DNA-binding IclR family transcriptional regulator
MLNPEQNAAVVAWIMGNSARPMKAARAWAECFTVLRPDTGEIDARREELADRIGVPPAEISRIMGELETCGAIIRKRERVPGMRGAGIVRYFMNPRVGTHLAGAARDEAQAAAPRLRLVEG